MSYFDCSDAEGLGPDPCISCKQPLERDGHCPDCDGPECIHGYDLFSRNCLECEYLKLSAADGGEGDDDMDPDKLMESYQEDPRQAGGDAYFTRPLDQYTPYELAAMAARIDGQLDRLEDMAAKLAKDVAQARSGKKPRATRSDAGKPRAPKPSNDVPRNGEGVAV